MSRPKPRQLHRRAQAIFRPLGKLHSREESSSKSQVCSIRRRRARDAGPAHRQTMHIRDNMEQNASHNVPGWLEWNPAQLTAKVVALPTPEDVPYEVNLNLIIEFYR